MSLEQAIMQNTEMLIKIYALLQTKAGNDLNALLKEPRPAETIATSTEHAKKLPDPEVKKTPESAPQPVPTGQEAIRVLMDLAKINRAAAVEVLNKYNVKKAPDVPENRRADFVNDIMSKLNDLKG